MLLLRPELVDPSYRALPPARYSMVQRAVPNFPLRNGGQGYVGHPALADPAFAKAAIEVLMQETMTLVDGVLDGTVDFRHGRSPFYTLPFFRTEFWPVTLAAAVGLAIGAVVTLGALGRKKTDGRRADRRA
jgi:hypothetical protein